MALNCTEIFTKIGRFGRILYLLNTGQAAMPAGYTSLYTEFGAEFDEIVGPVAQSEEAGIRAMSSLAGAIQSAANAYLLAAVKADAPTAALTITDALNELRNQMIDQSEDVNACAVGITPTAVSGATGTGVLVTSTKRGDGVVQEHIVAESARLRCTADSYSEQATEGREPFRFVGEREEWGRFDKEWPIGSNAQATLNAVSADVDADAGSNLLTNGDFEEWSADATPNLDDDGWVSADTYGTHLARSNTAYRGTYALQFTAANNATKIYQQFDQDDGTGTAADPLPQTNYAVNFWCRSSANTVSNGVLTVALVDDTGTTINDEAGTANSFTVDLTTLNTTWVNKTGVFRLPAVKPSVVRFEFEVTTNLAGANVLVDDVCCSRMALLYPGGPYASVFSGETPFLTGDGWDIATTNDRGGATYPPGTFQTLFLKLFQQPTFLLPSDTGGTETQADTLITGA